MTTPLRGLDSIDVVVNAAGPFAFTAEILAKSALERRCHYVDINGEVDVYKMLDDLGIKAAQRGVAMVSGAGYSAAASDLLLDVALNNKVMEHELGAVRIAMSQIGDFSRGSAATLMRSLREEVIVIRKRPAADGAKGPEVAICHVPVGKLERMFEFGPRPDKRKDQEDQKNKQKRDFGIASAANLIDTLTAKHTVLRNCRTVHTIESYVQIGILGRIAYQLGGMFSSFSALPWIRPLVEAQVSLLPEGPSQQELKNEKKPVVLLEIEDVYHQRLIDWRWETPNVYQFTAQLVVEIARKVAENKKKKRGWVTPAEALGLTCPQDLSGDRSRPFRDCKLEKRELEEEERELGQGER